MSIYRDGFKFYYFFLFCVSVARETNFFWSHSTKLNLIFLQRSQAPVFLNDSEEQRLLDRLHCITYREIRDEMISRTDDLSLSNGFPKNYTVTKVGYDELGLTLLKNIIHSLEVVDLRYSLKRTKTSSCLQVVLGVAALEKLQEKFWRKQDSV